jgi:glutamate formiminotransferase
MKRLIECVPNFSEGRDARKVDTLIETMSKVPGVWVLDHEMDADHNRSVITLAGEPDAVAEAALLGTGKAVELIDMTQHTGAHPRVGATDVVPFIPVEGVSLEDCVPWLAAWAMKSGSASAFRSSTTKPRPPARTAST